MRRLTRPDVDAYTIPATTTGASGFRQLRGGGRTGSGVRVVEVGANGEIELRLVRGTTETARWLVPAERRPCRVTVPSSMHLEVQRPAATAPIPGDVLVTVADITPNTAG